MMNSDFKKVKNMWVSKSRFKTKKGAERKRLSMPLGNNFKTFKSRSDGLFRIKLD